VGLAARRAGTTGDVTKLPLLGGSQVATFINPDAGAVKIATQPQSATVPAGQRLQLSVSATAPLGGTLFYQWQVDRVDIPGATRPTYVTPILTAADNQKKYHVIIGVNGTDVPSQDATVTVGPAQASPFTPYVGVNFADGTGAGTTPGASLATNDVAGFVLQENFNNVLGTTIDGTQPLVDAQGAPTPVTIAVYDPATDTVGAANATIGTGTGSGNVSANHLMMQGSIANNDTPLSLKLSGVPAGNYALIAYSVGFSFNSTYEEDFSLVGATTSPTVTGRGQTSTEFIANPAFVRMSSTDPAKPDHGNYVMFENVSPAADGTLLLTVTPQSTNVGNAAYFPPVNAVQLVKQSKVAAAPPSLSVLTQGGNLTISWGGDATGYLLESSTLLGTTASWSTVAGTPNPIAGAGSVTVNPNLKSQYYRLKK
jgi:hypothetical protein